MARLGQCFSTSLDTIGITLQEGVRYREIDDVERNGFCFSDGIGTISPDLASEVIGLFSLFVFRVMNMTFKIYFTQRGLTKCSTLLIVLCIFVLFSMKRLSSLKNLSQISRS